VAWGRGVVPLGKAGIDGSPGIDGAGDTAISGEPVGLAPGRPVVPLGKPGDLHWGGMGVNGRLGRLDTCTGLWVSGSSAISLPPGAPKRCPGVH
jgi:hypothetical protein